MKRNIPDSQQPARYPEGGSGRSGAQMNGCHPRFLEADFEIVKLSELIRK
jgi:hypothetical protein